MTRRNSEELRAMRLSLNTPDGFAMSRSAIASLIDELLELRDYVVKLQPTTRTEIFNAVLAAMQPAEELGGPEGVEYLGLMADIARAAQGRAETYANDFPNRCRTCGAFLNANGTSVTFNNPNCPGGRPHWRGSFS